MELLVQFVFSIAAGATIAPMFFRGFQSLITGILSIAVLMSFVMAGPMDRGSYAVTYILLALLTASLSYRYYRQRQASQQDPTTRQPDGD